MNIGTTFDLVVHEKHLDTGVHEYMVWYTAMVSLIPDNTSSVTLVLGCHVPDDYYDSPVHHENLMELALDAINRGAHDALSEYGLGAEFRFSEFMLHVVDFQPRRFYEHTRDCLAQAIRDHLL